MKKELSFTEIIADLKSRGEHNINFHENGSITSKHGKSTLNFWAIIDNELRCIDCKTIYSFSI